MGRQWTACLLISSYGIQAAALAAVRQPAPESLWSNVNDVDDADLVSRTYVVPAGATNRLFVAPGQRKPVMWVHIHKMAGTFMCVSAGRAGESVVSPNDGNCNSVAMHDTFFPDGLLSVPHPPPCKRRAAYFLEHNFTWGQVEHEIDGGDLCKSDFIYGITLRETISRLTSYVNWNAKKVIGSAYRQWMACIEQRNTSMCPYNPEWNAKSAINFGYVEFDNFAVRSLGGYDVMLVPPGGLNRTHYDLAVSALKKLDIVLALEEMFTNHSQALMDAAIGWHVEQKDPPERKNPHKTTFTDGDVKRLIQINRFDAELYAKVAQASRASAVSLPQGAEGPQARIPKAPQTKKGKPH